MNNSELINELKLGEDSGRQFKENITNSESLASEIVAFSNGAGGTIYIGVSDDGSVSGLSDDDIRRLNQLISVTASQYVIPAVNPVTENIIADKKLVIRLYIRPGINKPYQDKNGVF